MGVVAPATTPIRGLVDGGWSGSGASPAAVLARADNMRPRHEMDVLQPIGIGIGTLGVISTLYAFYWFVRMRRNFRQDLVVLLIQSDLIKSLSFVIFPLVNNRLGPIASDSAFCQASGFFFHVGIESSDVAILLITLHSALYIIRPRSGLHPYRRYAYALYVVLPLLAASLAFIGGYGYENNGLYCSLRNDQGWEHLALSWIPRYVIFIMILLTYMGSYAYARSMMVQYGGEDCRCYGRDSQVDHCCDASSTPRIECHGLVSSAPSSRPGSSRRADMALTGRVSSISSANITELGSARLPDQRKSDQTTVVEQYQLPVNWNWPSVTGSMSAQNDPSFRSSCGRNNGTHLTRVPDPLEPTPQSSAPSETDLTDGIRSLFPTINSPHSTGDWPSSPAKSHMADPDARSSETSVAEGMGGSPQTSLASMLSFLRPGRSYGPKSSSTQDILAPGAIQDDVEIARIRETIFHKLRTRFVYPMAYMLTWIFPFVRHVQKYDDMHGTLTPFWLLIVATVSLSLQGAVDCTVFLIREEPWKHTQGGFWSSLNRRLREWWRKGWRKTRVVGRTSEEMVVDGRQARERRREEMVAERVARGTQEAGARGRGGRDWWDAALEGAEGEEEEEEERDGPAK